MWKARSWYLLPWCWFTFLGVYVQALPGIGIGLDFPTSPYVSSHDGMLSYSGLIQWDSTGAQLTDPILANLARLAYNEMLDLCKTKDPNNWLEACPGAMLAYWDPSVKGRLKFVNFVSSVKGSATGWEHILDVDKNDAGSPGWIYSKLRNGHRTGGRCAEINALRLVSEMSLDNRFSDSSVTFAVWGQQRDEDGRLSGEPTQLLPCQDKNENRYAFKADGNIKQKKVWADGCNTFCERPEVKPHFHPIPRIMNGGGFDEQEEEIKAKMTANEAHWTWRRLARIRGGTAQARNHYGPGHSAASSQSHGAGAPACDLNRKRANGKATGGIVCKPAKKSKDKTKAKDKKVKNKGGRVKPGNGPHSAQKVDDKKPVHQGNKGKDVKTKPVGKSGPGKGGKNSKTKDKTSKKQAHRPVSGSDAAHKKKRPHAKQHKVKNGGKRVTKGKHNGKKQQTGS